MFQGICEKNSLGVQLDQRTFSDLKYRSGRERMQPFKVRLIEQLLAEPRGRVLDIGCGSGVVSEIMKEHGFTPVGVDISQEAIAQYCSKGMEGIACDIEQVLPFEPGSFDAAWLSEVLEHIRNHENLVSQIYGVLKPGGKLFLTTPNSSFYLYRILGMLGKSPSEMQHAQHVRFFNYAMLVTLLKKQGFTIERTLGQNIYGFLPASFFDELTRKHPRLGRLARAVLSTLRFRRCEGFVHGDKYMLFSFSRHLSHLLSNTVMLVAQKQSAK